MPRVVILTRTFWNEAKWRGLILKTAVHLQTYSTHVREAAQSCWVNTFFNKISWAKIDPVKLSGFTGTAFQCRAVLFAFSFMTTSMWRDSSWSLNYMSKMREGGRLIHHSREARQSELAAFSSSALKAQEPCLKLQCKACLAANFSMTPRSVTCICYVEVFCFYFNVYKRTKISSILVPSFFQANYVMLVLPSTSVLSNFKRKAWTPCFNLWPVMLSNTDKFS